MKYRIGQIIRDTRDDEVSKIIGINNSGYLIKCLKSGNGGKGNGLLRVPPGEERKVGSGSIDPNWILDESFTVSRILDAYEET